MTAPRKKPDSRFGGRRTAEPHPTTRPSAKHTRESKLLVELQRDHGYMFATMPRERDSYTTQVRGIRSGKMAMTPARVMRVIVPDESQLATHADQGRKRIRKDA